MGSSGQKCLCIQSVSSSICCSLGSREGGGGGWTLGHSGLRRPLPHHHQDQVDKGAALVASSIPLLLLIKRHSHLLALSSLAHNLPPAGPCLSQILLKCPLLNPWAACATNSVQPHAGTLDHPPRLIHLRGKFPLLASVFWRVVVLADNSWVTDVVCRALLLPTRCIQSNMSKRSNSGWKVGVTFTMSLVKCDQVST